MDDNAECRVGGFWCWGLGGWCFLKRLYRNVFGGLSTPAHSNQRTKYYDPNPIISMVQPYFIPLPLSSSNPSFPCSSSSCPRRNRLFSKRTFKAGALNLNLRAGSQAESVIVEGALKAITAACD